MKKSFIKSKGNSYFRAAVILLLLTLITVLTISCLKTPETSVAPGETTTETSGEKTGVITSEEAPTGSDEKVLFYSPSSVSTDKDGNVYVSDATMNRVYKYSQSGEIIKQLAISETVTKVVAYEGNVYILSGNLGGKLTITDESLTVKSEVSVGHTPSDIVINGDKAYVCNRFSSDITVVDIEQGKTQGSYTVGREPCCMAIAGNSIYIGCFMQDGSCDRDYISAKVAVFDMSENKVNDNIELVNGTKCIQGIVATPDGKRVFLTHLVGRYAYPTTQLDRGWVNTNAISMIYTNTNESVTMLLDDLENGAANPYGIDISDNGGKLYITSSGTNEIITVDIAKTDSLISSVKSGKHDYCKSAVEIADYIPFLKSAKTRTTLDGKGLRDIEYSNEKLFVAEYFTGDVVVLNSETLEVISKLIPGEQPEYTEERYGEYLWNDAVSTYQQWQSCASCHPDGRNDALNWDEAGDGLGTPKNTPSILYSLRTPPVMKTGLCENGEIMVDESVVGAKLAVFTEDELEAMYAYLRSLLPVESPYLAEGGEYSEKALEGRELFNELGCTACHPSPLYTDMKKHTSPFIGSDGTTENRAFDTPSLVEIWRTAPYIYSGGINDISEIIEKFSPRKLSQDELSSLTEYVLSIGTVGEQFGVEEVFGTMDSNTVVSALKPGMSIDTITIRYQSDDVEEATVKVTLYTSDKKTVFEKTENLKFSAEGELKTMVIGEKLPEDFKSGGYLTVNISGYDGKEIASEYKLVYSD